MSLFNIFNVAGSAMSAQSQRLNVVTSNIANAESTTSADGKTYRAKQVEFMATPGKDASATGVRVTRVVEDTSPLKVVFDPKHPNADATGHVSMPNVNVVEEMVNMISASRSYQTNVETMNTAKTMLLKTLTLGQ
ncbi:MAG: flagellar basal body rod protein FlgC [Oxalicibacterium faecigallinarum]|uniref:Flagellar basal-body rod protein FlgC n=1 Tax=Oxalicibacterium faecigallinarum TaxID=573741 RepID=A0A8J3AP98_9BURK|nr:flagellar basal body rod protein FlgC [Oxalicibacterium faecigallinarum]MDQ7969705.1 flagellar basal body rod protein FlgC [Oxalicibacterium faecigallinarum]GGI16314.1 flagellar basal-body rod protein FlgC [Oxalicibacterium faecigallinarum]